MTAHHRLGCGRGDKEMSVEYLQGLSRKPLAEGLAAFLQGLCTFTRPQSRKPYFAHLLPLQTS